MTDVGTYCPPRIIVGRHTAFLPPSSSSCGGYPRADEERCRPGRRRTQLPLRGILKIPPLSPSIHWPLSQ